MAKPIPEVQQERVGLGDELSPARADEDEEHGVHDEGGDVQGDLLEIVLVNFRGRIVFERMDTQCAF